MHTRAYRLRLEATNRGTGYFIKHIDPLRLADHARLARSCLLVRPPSWRMVFELRAVPDGSDAQWETLAEAWQRLGRTRAPQPDAAAVSDAQAQWLGTVDRLIDMTEEHSVREERETAPFPYQRVRSTGGRRNSTTPQSMYEFRLLGPALPPAGAFVRVQGDLETRGRVHRAAEGSVTVRFDQPVSWDRLPERGALELVPSTVVFSKQRQAVASLRTGDTENPHLLRAMVDHRVRGIPPTGARPRERLDPEQTDAFRKALTTEDLLVVLGPPGTGKTRTITEIAHTAATTTGTGGGRVLVTSHTNRAVDNVLARLPRDLVVIRVGDDSKVHADVKPLLLEEQSENLSEGIRHTMAHRLRAYREAEAAALWTAELSSRLDQVDGSARDVRDTAARLHHAVQAATAPARARREALRHQDDERESARSALADRAARLQEKVRSLRQRSDRPLTGWLHRARARRADEELTGLRPEIQRLEVLGRELRRQIEAETAEADRAAREDPAVASARAAHQAAEHLLGKNLQSAYEAAGVAVQALSTVVPDVSAPAPPRDPAEAAAALHTLRAQLEAWLPIVSARHALTQEWRTAVGEDPGQLVPELVRYAHVVGATCIGAASRPELSGVPFDLGIIDEAGQIGVADALVPLTRVRRGVLVGDDRQLPPFLDTAVADRARETGDPGLLRLTSQSALEQLRAGLPASHVVQLTRQRRMPAEIADFVSVSFYRGGTAHREGPPAHRPLVHQPDGLRRHLGPARPHPSRVAGTGHRGPGPQGALQHLRGTSARPARRLLPPAGFRVGGDRPLSRAAHGGRPPPHRADRRLRTRERLRRQRRLLPGRGARCRPLRLHPQQPRRTRRIPQGTAPRQCRRHPRQDPVGAGGRPEHPAQRGRPRLPHPRRGAAPAPARPR
ncbi:DNA2/NAM7 helicase helicase domain-containing protein OS=Streptomyces fumanus OX=67302 GN=GCM10018772_67360 PE=4 SV=1 [Streptomyces fumanus]